MKTLNYLKTYIFLSFGLFFITAQAQTVVDTHGRLQVNGNKVTAEDGTEISLAGMSLFWSNAAWSLSDFYKPEVVNYLADNWKASIIRAAVGVKENWDSGRGYLGTESVFVPDGTWDSGKEYTLERTEAVIEAAIAKGIYVIVDWHTHEAEKYPDAAVEFFTYIADKYGNNDHIIYEIYNEPINQSWNTIKNYARPVIQAIRSKDPDNLIIVGSRTWSQRVDEASKSPITGDPNLAYTLHFYANTHKQDLRDKAIEAMSTENGNTGIALFVTEWGSVDASGDGGYNPSETNVWMDFLKDNKISHANWSLSDMNETSAAVQFRADSSNRNNSDGTGDDRFIDTSLSDQQKLTEPGRFVKNIILNQAVDTTLSIGDFNDGTSYSVLPSPFNDFITINAEASVDAITVFDMTGRVILSKEIQKLNPSISLGVLTPGNYILSIESNGNIASSIITRSK